jgi:hypothetical protein
MELTPCVGIGDFLVLKAIDISNNLNICKIHLSNHLVTNYRAHPDRFIHFITQLIKMLFPNTMVDLVDDKFQPVDYRSYTMISPYLYDHVHLPLKDVPHQNYITFHTKIRLESEQDKFMWKSLPKIESFLKKFKTRKTIIIMGERTVEDCFEARVLSITSLYKSLNILRKHNHVIDLTKEILYSGNPNYDDFVYDLNIIHKAELNVTFGIGGPFGLCHAFAKNNLSYIGTTHEYDHLFKKYTGIHRRIKPFLEELSTYMD